MCEATKKRGKTASLLINMGSANNINEHVEKKLSVQMLDNLTFFCVRVRLHCKM